MSPARKAATGAQIVGKPDNFAHSAGAFFYIGRAQFAHTGDDQIRVAVPIQIGGPDHIRALDKADLVRR